MTSGKRKTSPEPDKQLLREARRGNASAFTRLMRTYEPLVYRFAFKVCRNREDASETMQDTFVNVYRKLDQFDARSKFTTWLYSIVSNNCLMKRRKRKIDTEMIRLDEVESSPSRNPMSAASRGVRGILTSEESPVEGILDKELREILDAAILRLPVSYRIVFILIDAEGKPAKEVARILNLSVPAVKSRLRRARLFLREQLSEYVTT